MPLYSFSKFIRKIGDTMTGRLVLPSLQTGVNPIQPLTTIVSVVAGVSAELSLPATATLTAAFINIDNVNRQRLVQVNTTDGSTTVTGNFLATDVGAGVYPTTQVLTYTQGVNTTRMRITGVNPSTGISSSELELIPDARLDPANRIASEILLYNVVGTNYERSILANFDHTFGIITSSEGVGVTMPIVIQTGGNVGHNTAGVNALKVYGDASTEILSASYITGISVLDSGVFTKITGIRSVVAGVSAYLSIAALSTGTINVWVQPGHGVGRVVTGVGTTLGSRTITGNFLATDILDFINQVEVNAGGTGYSVGDSLTIIQGGNNAKAIVTSVSAGVVTGVKVDVNNVGSGYTGGLGLSTTGGTGTGCTLDVGCSGAAIWSLPSVASVFTTTRTVTDGVTTNASTTVTSASAAFISGDVGRSVRGDGIPDGTFIASYTSATSVDLSQAATRSGTGVSLTFGESWVLDTAIGTSTGFSTGARSKINVTIVGSAGTALKSNVYVTSGKTVIVPAIGATGDQLPVIGDVALVAYGQKTFANGVLRLTDPFNTGNTQMVLDTITGAGGTSATSNKVRMYFKRGGTTKWIHGLNASFGNIDSYDFIGSDSANKLILTQTGDIRHLGYLYVGSTSAPTNTTAGDATVTRLFATSANIPTINDTNGNELIKFTTTASAVNELTIANAATLGNVIVSTTGDDSNISMQFAPKGTGKFIVKPASLSTTAFQVLNTSSAGIFLVDTTNVRIGVGTGSPVNTISIVGTAAKTVGMERHSTADTAGNNLTILSGGATSGATNKAAGNLILQTGLSTGSGSGQILLQTTANTAGSTSDNAVATRLTIDLNGLTIAEAHNIILGTTTGTKIGTGTTQKLAFYNSTPIVQQTDGAGLTNNAVASGTTNQIDDFTSLVTYALDAQAIHNDIYQLARKMKIVDDALRSYGLLS